MNARALSVSLALSWVCVSVPLGLGQVVERAEVLQLPTVAPKLANVEGQRQKHVLAAAERQRRKFQRYLAIRIDELRRVCRLSDQQAKTLEVAAKGAAEQVMQKWQKQAIRAPRQMRAVFPAARAVANVDNFAVDGGDDANADEAAGELAGGVVVKPRERIAVAADVPAFINPVEVRIWPKEKVGDELVWIRTVDRVLTDEQRQAYRDAIGQRKAFGRKAVVYNIVACLDDRLLLTRSQCEQLAQIIGKTVDGRAEIFQPTRLPPLTFVSRAVARTPRAEVQAILSESQLAEWDTLGR